MFVKVPLLAQRRQFGGFTLAALPLSGVGAPFPTEGLCLCHIRDLTTTIGRCHHKFGALSTCFRQVAPMPSFAALDFSPEVKQVPDDRHFVAPLSKVATISLYVIMA